MGTVVAKAYHPINGSTEDISEGFCWPCLFFGCFWYMYKGLWGWALISFLLAMLTLGISWLVFPFLANSQYADALRKRGYLTQSQWEARQRPDRDLPQEAPAPPISVADELAKLGALREKGMITEEEFTRQKARLLS